MRLTLLLAVFACLALVRTVCCDGTVVTGRDDLFLPSKYLFGEYNPTRFAYVSIHYEGTPRDYEYILGLRVWIKSIQLTQSEQDIVILASENVSQETIKAFTSDGAIVKRISNIDNPYKAGGVGKKRTYKKRFEFTFNKLYMWNMTEYEAVMYMDADNIVLHNMDEAFLCGDFCAIFMNPVFFHTGLMVIRPDPKAFKALVTALHEGSKYSYDGADQGFLTAYFTNLITAPLFDYATLADAYLSNSGAVRELGLTLSDQRTQLSHFAKDPSDVAVSKARLQENDYDLTQVRYRGLDPTELYTVVWQRDKNGRVTAVKPQDFVDAGGASGDLTHVRAGFVAECSAQRLPVEYNINHLYYYAHFSFDTWRRLGHWFSSMETPATSIGYPVAPAAKPWYWYCPIFFDVHKKWHNIRAFVPDSIRWGLVLTQSVVLLALAALCIDVLGLLWLRFVYSVDQNNNNSYARVRAKLSKQSLISRIFSPRNDDKKYLPVNNEDSAEMSYVINSPTATESDNNNNNNNNNNSNCDDFDDMPQFGAGPRPFRTNMVAQSIGKAQNVLSTHVPKKWTASVMALVVVIASWWIATDFIPKTVPYQLGLVIYVILHNVVLWCAISVVSLLMGTSVHVTSTGSEFRYAGLLPSKSNRLPGEVLKLFCCELAFYVVCLHPFHFHFIEKVLFLVIGLGAVFYWRFTVALAHISQK